MREYRGKIIKVESSVRKVPFDWSHTAIPQDAKMYGLVWTACSDVTPIQVEMIGGQGVLLILDPTGEEFLRMTLSKIPLEMGPPYQFTFYDVPTSKPISFNSTWRAEIAFHDRRADPENGVEARLWSSFPGRTRIRVDIIDRAEETVNLPHGG